MKRRKVLSGLLLVALLLLGVVASGCVGGGGSATRTSSTQEESSGTESTGAHPGTTSTSQPATWQTPWDAYHSVEVGGDSYYITEVEYTYTIKTPDLGEMSFNVLKKRGYIKAHIYADENGEKKDLGEYNLFAYYGKITPINNESLKPFEYIIAVKERSEDSDQWFLSPSPDLNAMSTGGSALVEIKRGDEYFYWSNPGAIGQYSELPYTEGDFNEVMGDTGGYIYTFWISMMGSGAWTGLEDYDLMKAGEYDYSFPPFAYHYKVKPDGTVTFGGKDFRVSNVEWSYSFGGANLQGRGKIAPALPIPVESEGTFVDLSSGTKAYSKIKVEDMKLSKEFSGISVNIEKPISEGTSTETETETETETPAPSESSQNWQRTWDASEPISINGEKYLIREITYEINAKDAGGSYHYTMRRGYRPATFNGEDVYETYILLQYEDGRIYNYTAYVPKEDIEEFTGYLLWMPTVFQFIEAPDYLKLIIIGPNCQYSIDEEGNLEGDPSCGMELHEKFFDNMWDVNTGFAGGIYGDVVHVADLSSNGEGYSIVKDGHIELAGIKFSLYNVTWSGSMRGYFQANGWTLVSPQLPFPVEIEAAVSGVPDSVYIHTKITAVKIEKS